MEFMTFGDKNNKSIMFLHGNLMSWKQFIDVIPMLENDYHVIAVSLDGFDGTGKTTYPGAQKEADLLAEYIKNECDGRLDCLFAESLGCCPAPLMKNNITIRIENMILSGAECLDCGIFNGLLLKIMPKKQYKIVQNYKTPDYRFPNYLLKLTGQTQEGIKKLSEATSDNISIETIRETWKAGLYLYRTVDTLSVQPDAKVSCWYGEKESGMKKAIKKLRRLYPMLTICCFKGYGHGEIISHPQQLADGIKEFIRR